ncbi:hypothetical protein K432DRAFT_98498 [Lepidopterella palustris CBS 459.81]|uniref:Uncharacterized protein n=1 Tax=Lepidopterella palustris CBS 459.81 TaxID=1314670 RepID=A0A8E2JJK1_9PEZI|nr:hypothetical protein K432DRAFT_98498 [Lepidopterella palustris CBS 459.81]
MPGWTSFNALEGMKLFTSLSITTLLFAILASIALVFVAFSSIIMLFVIILVGIPHPLPIYIHLQALSIVSNLLIPNIKYDSLITCIHVPASRTIPDLH